MFNRKLHSHSFKLIWYSADSDKLIQLIECQTCKKRFWGYAGKILSPRLLHEVKKDIPLIEHIVFNEKSNTFEYTNGL